MTDGGGGSMSDLCAAHPDRAAVYECDGCKKLLCEQCMEEGHRLLFCRHCGEMAVPLVSGAPVTTTELARERKVTAAYGLADSLAYPFRGLGLYLFAGYVILLLLLDLINWLPGLGCAVLLVRLFIGMILPGLLFAIVRTSAEGEIELPDWPDWSEYFERIGEWFSFLLVMVMATLPTVLFLWLGGCGFNELVDGGWGPACGALIALGLVVGVMLWVPGVGAVGTYGSGWLGWRADLHIKALINVWDDAWRTIALLAGLWLVSLILQVILGFVPVLGTISSVAVGVYTLFVGAHLIGLLFRRNPKMLESIYLG